MSTKKLMKIATAVLTICTGICAARAQVVIHVDDDAAPGGDGSSWASAKKYLQDALFMAVTGDEIRVAGGFYKPDVDDGGSVSVGDRSATFQLVNGVELYGGYRGCPGGDCLSGDPNERAIDDFESLLSGDLAGDDDSVGNGENTFHVVTGTGTDHTSIIDGFTITGGNANGADAVDKWGGGLLNHSGSPTVVNCRFIGNTAEQRGGGVFNHVGASKFASCSFIGNTSGLEGGAMYNRTKSGLRLDNCAFIGNEADYGGSVYSWDYVTATLVNCTFAANTALFGAAIACDSLDQTRPSTLEFANCVIWDGVDGVWNNDGSMIQIVYSDVQGGWPDVGNIYSEPLFRDVAGADGVPGTSDDDVRLSPGSPCIDAGNNEVVIEETDLGLDPRLVDDTDTPDAGYGTPPIVDMGAYEYQGCISDLDCDDGLFCNGSEQCVAYDCLPADPPDCDDGLTCTEDSCNELDDRCENVLSAGACLIDDVCYGDGDINPSNECEDCAPSTSSFNWSPRSAGSACGDGTDGECTNPDSCDGLGNCLSNDIPDQTPCDDLDHCNVGESCLAGVCTGGGNVDCSGAGSVCNTASCDPGGAEGNCDVLTPLAAGTPCADALFCNGSETCDGAGECQAGSDPCPGRRCRESDDACVECLMDSHCSDGIACTIDSCEQTAGYCVSMPNDALCDNGLFCDGRETCDRDNDCQSGDPPCPVGFQCDEQNRQCSPITVPSVSMWGMVILTLLILARAKIAFDHRWSLRS